MHHIILLLTILHTGTILFSQTPPNPRHLERIAFDSDRNKLVLYGGSEQGLGGGWSNPSSVYEWNESGWKEFNAQGPGSRNGPALIYSPQEKATFLIGGVTQKENNTTVNLDVWKWNGKEWQLVNADIPFRNPEAVYCDENKSILAYGDINNKTQPWRSGDPQRFELWEFKSGAWKKLSVAGPQIGSPYEMSYDKKRQALIIPTWDRGKAIVWEWKDGQWNKIRCTENYPVARNRFSLAYHEKENVTYLFGGRNNANPFLNDFWKWDGKIWTKVETKEAPAMRAAATMEYGNGGLFLYGGVVEWGLTNEIWYWKYGSWKLLNGEYAMDANRTLESLKQLVNTNPNDAGVLSRYGSMLKLAKQNSEAESIYKRAVSLNPKEHNTLFALAELLYNQNKDSEAESYISNAVAASLMESRSYSRLGVLLMSIKKYNEAVPCLEKALAMEPRGTDFYNLACAYALMNNKDKAIEALSKVVETGYGSKKQFEGDADLQSLKSDSRFQELLTKLK